jgi:hypothetical protein
VESNDNNSSQHVAGDSWVPSACVQRGAYVCWAILPRPDRFRRIAPRWHTSSHALQQVNACLGIDTQQVATQLPVSANYSHLRQAIIGRPAPVQDPLGALAHHLGRVPAVLPPQQLGGLPESH